MARSRSNVRGAQRALDDLVKRAEGELTDGAMFLIATEVLADVATPSGTRGVPEDEGTLRDSGRVDHRGGRHTSIVFGGAAAPYALVQHERTDFEHTVGEARYLVRAVDRYDFDTSEASVAVKANMDAAARRARAAGRSAR